MWEIKNAPGCCSLQPAALDPNPNPSRQTPIHQMNPSWKLACSTSKTRVKTTPEFAAQPAHLFSDQRREAQRAAHNPNTLSNIVLARQSATFLLSQPCQPSQPASQPFHATLLFYSDSAVPVPCLKAVKRTGLHFLGDLLATSPQIAAASLDGAAIRVLFWKLGRLEVRGTGFLNP